MPITLTLFSVLILWNLVTTMVPLSTKIFISFSAHTSQTTLETLSVVIGKLTLTVMRIKLMIYSLMRSGSMENS
jgi:hypothetical protein